MSRNKQPWKEYPTPRPLGYVAGIPSLNGELLRRRGQIAVMQLADGREMDIHLESFIGAQRAK